MQPHALIRAVPHSFVGCVTGEPLERPLDPELAQVQHAAYRAALEGGGFTTFLVAADEAHPDCAFVEDAAIVIGGRALATRPGHPSRRGEVGPVIEALGHLVPTEQVRAPACLDGGDVLQVGERIFVGVSARTNRAGVEAVARFGGPDRPVMPVEVAGALHLKSIVTSLDDQTLLMEPGLIDDAPFAGLRIVPTAPGERHAGNVVRLPDGSILAAAAAPATAEAVVRAGYQVRLVDVSEFGRADGGLTCLSIRVRRG